MTFKITIRGAPIAAREYACEQHGAFELVVDLATSRDPRPCPTCAAPSERTLTSNILNRMALSVESGTGKSDPPPSPLAFNTRAMYEKGQTVSEFRADRRKLHRDRERARAKQKGLI